MTHKEANTLIDRTMKVILSCKTMEQLNAAIGYANLAYSELFRNGLSIERARFTPLIERSVGYAQCQIKHN